MNVRVTELPNGLRVVTEHRPTLESASIGVWVDVGARFEPLAQSGITHCLEHMVFKGTRRRSARDIAFEIEAVGGHLNAYTSRDHTTYYARILKDDLPLAVDLLADLLTGSILDEEELRREKEVICQEIGQSIDTPDDIIFDYLQECAYRDQPLGRSILGTNQSVRGLRQADLHTFLKDKYHAGAVVVAAVGNLDHDGLVAMVAEKFADLPSARKEPVEKARFTGGEYRDVRALEQLHVALGFEGLPFGHEDYYAIQVYSTLLGGGMSSRLFQHVREERGLAYAIYSFTTSHADTGLFGIYGGTSDDLGPELLNVIRGQMENSAAGLDESEVTLAKAQLKAGLLMGLESTSARMEQLGRQMLIFSQPIGSEEIIRKIDSVTAADVCAQATRMLESPARAFSAIGGADIETLKP